MRLNASDLLLLSQRAISAAYQAGDIIKQYTHHPLRNEDLIIPESMTQNFGFTGVLETQTHSRLRNCFSGATVEPKDKSDSGIIEFSSLTVNRKKGGSSIASQVVTEVDLLCQDIILQILLPSSVKYDIALLTEESPDTLERLEKDFFWCIDPLDGTLPFIESTPGYAVSIALVAHDGTPYIGVIYDPVEQTLYHAIKGSGAFRNNKPWDFRSVSSSRKPSLTFITDRSFSKHKLYSKIQAGLKNIAAKNAYSDVNTILHGGAVMNACWVLEHAPACYFKFPKPESGGGSLWDYAATACLFTEAGAIVSDIHGKPLNLNRPDSSFMNHRGVLYASDPDIAREVMYLFQGLEG